MIRFSPLAGSQGEPKLTRHRLTTCNLFVLSKHLEHWSLYRAPSLQFLGTYNLKNLEKLVRLQVTWPSGFASASMFEECNLKCLALAILLKSIGQVKGVVHLVPLKDVQPTIKKDLPAMIGHDMPSVN